MRTTHPVRNNIDGLARLGPKVLRHNCVNPVRGGPEVAARLEKCEREKSESGITAPLFGLGTGKPTDVRIGLAIAKGEGGGRGLAH